MLASRLGAGGEIEPEKAARGLAGDLPGHLVHASQCFFEHLLQFCGSGGQFRVIGKRLAYKRRRLETEGERVGTGMVGDGKERRPGWDVGRSGKAEIRFAVGGDLGDGEDGLGGRLRGL